MVSPKYLTIKNRILVQIRTGKLRPGAQISSINEIMEEFGVSKVTAVRALTELESDGLVKREHGRGTFVSNQDTATLQVRSSKRVAMVVPNMQNPFNVEVVGSVEKHLREAGIVIELSCTDYEPAVERELFNKYVSSGQQDGMVLISGSVKSMGVDVGKSRTPLVVIDHCPEDLLDRCVFIDCDHYKGGYDAAKHLAGFGHTKIGYIDWLVASRARLAGFRRALEDSQLTLPEERVLTLSSNRTLGDEVADFVRQQELTALFAVNDMFAMQAMQLLRAQGYGIPQDISLMGYDDVVAARYLEVPLTSVEQHEEQIGHKAAESILALMNRSQTTLRPREILIVPRVVERASTGPPRSPR